MYTQRKTGITGTIIGSAQRLFRSGNRQQLMTGNPMDARTMKDIGVRPVDLY